MFISEQFNLQSINFFLMKLNLRPLCQFVIYRGIVLCSAKAFLLAKD